MNFSTALDSARTNTDTRRHVAASAFLEVLLCLSYTGSNHHYLATRLAKLVPGVLHELLHGLHVPVPLGGYAIVAAGAAVLEYAFRLHERLPPFRRCRCLFDSRHILVPLAAAVGVEASENELSMLRATNPDLMDQVFYRYAGSEHPVIDGHLVSGALDSWRWAWIFIESAAVSLVSGIWLAVFRDWVGLGTGIISCVVFWCLFKAAINQAGSYADREVRAIKRLNRRAKQDIRQTIQGALYPTEETLQE